MRPVAIPLIDRGQVAATLLTSGSTGTPQPHAKTWGQLTMNVAAAARRLAELLRRPDLRGLNIVATVPAQHSYGFESSVLLGLLGGAAFDSGRPYFPADIARSLSALPRPRALVTTPFHLSMLLQSSVELPAVDLVLSATAPLSPQLAQQAERAFGGPLVEIYGCTEAGQVATRRTVRGELWQTFDNLTLSRLPGNDESGDRFMVQGGHVLEPTGLADILELESAQRFRLLGRANDLIDVAGKRSSLGHLNFQLNSIPGVVDGAFWLPDAVADRVVRPVAFVVAPALDAGQIRAALRERLEAVFVPRRIVLVDVVAARAHRQDHRAGAARTGAGARGGRGGRSSPGVTVPIDAAGGRVELVRRVAPRSPGVRRPLSGPSDLAWCAAAGRGLRGAADAAAAVGRIGRCARGAIRQVSVAGRPGYRAADRRCSPDALGATFEIRSGESLVAKGRLRPTPAP